MLLGAIWGGLRGSWWCLVLLGAAWRCLVVLGSAWWWFMVRGGDWWCLLVLGGAVGVWWGMAVLYVWFVPQGAAWR